MKSQKKSSQPYCIKCSIILTEENWPAYLKPRSQYICTSCFRAQNKEYHKSDIDYEKKQKDRYQMRRSAVIQSYGDCCKVCGEDRYECLVINILIKFKLNNLINHIYNTKVDLEKYQILCLNCDASVTHSNKDKNYAKEKTSAIEYYGGQCIECKEDRIEKLMIDYSILQCRASIKIYRYLRRNNYPKLDFKVLCYNCNCAKFISSDDMTESSCDNLF